MAKAYFIGQFDVHDPETYADYRSQTAATLVRMAAVSSSGAVASRISRARRLCRGSW